MKMVIDIPKHIYDCVIGKTVLLSHVDGMCKAIEEGTPLPKGHGDLIDRNDLLEYTDINECAYITTINRYEIITAPTIIEADKEASDG